MPYIHLSLRLRAFKRPIRQTGVCVGIGGTRVQQKYARGDQWVRSSAFARDPWDLFADLREGGAPARHGLWGVLRTGAREGARTA